MQINLCIDDAPQLQLTSKHNPNLSAKITKDTTNKICLSNSLEDI